MFNINSPTNAGPSQDTLTDRSIDNVQVSPHKRKTPVLASIQNADNAPSRKKTKHEFELRARAPNTASDTPAVTTQANPPRPPFPMRDIIDRLPVELQNKIFLFSTPESYANLLKASALDVPTHIDGWAADRDDKKLARRMLQSESVLHEMEEAIAARPTNSPTVVKRFLGILPNTGLRSVLVRSMQENLNGKLQSGTPDEIMECMSSMIDTIKDWKPAVGGADRSEASTFLTMTGKCRTYTDSLADSLDNPELAKKMTALQHAWGDAFAEGAFDAGDDWKPTLEAMGMSYDPNNQSLLKNDNLADCMKVMKGLAHYRQSRDVRNNVNGMPDLFSEKCQFVLALCQDNRLQYQDRVALLESLRNAGDRFLDGFPRRTLPVEEATRSIVEGMPSIRLSDEQKEALIYLACMSKQVAHRSAEQATAHLYIDALEKLTPSGTSRPVEILPSAVRDLLMIRLCRDMVSSRPDDWSTRRLGALRTLTPFVSGMSDDGRGKVLRDLSGSLNIGNASISDLKPLLEKLTPFVSRMSDGVCGDILTQLSVVLRQGKASIDDLKPLLEKLTPLPFFVSGMSDWMRGNVLSNLSAALFDGKASIDDLKPMLEKLTPFVSGMSDEGCGKTLWRLLVVLRRGNASIDDLKPLLEELTPFVSRISNERRGNVLAEVSAALFHGKATIDDLKPLLEESVPFVSGMSDKMRGQILSQLSSALFDGKASIDALKPLLEKLTPFISGMLDVGCGKTLWRLLVVLRRGNASIDDLRPVLQELTPFVSGMPDKTRGNVLSELSAVLFHGKASIDDLKPLFEKLTPFVPRMLDAVREEPLWHLLSALDTGKATIDDLKPLLEKLTPFVPRMSDEGRGKILWRLLVVLRRGKVSIDDLKPLLEELTPFVSGMSNEVRRNVLQELSTALERDKVSIDDLYPLLEKL